MKVKLEYENKNGGYSPSDDIDLNLDQVQLTALLNSDQVVIPKSFGPSSETVKYTEIINKSFDVYKDRENPIFIVRLKETSAY